MRGGALIGGRAWRGPSTLWQHCAMIERVGFIGLGRMGRRMAGRLLDAGLQLSVYDIIADKAYELAGRGARVASSARDAAEGAEAVVTSVTDGSAVFAALGGLDGVLHAAPPNLLLIEMSTIGLNDSQQIARASAAAKVRYVRAPVLGTIDAAEAGRLTALLSGAREDVGAALPILTHLTTAQHYLGHGEEARVVKLLFNGMLGVTMAAFAEALAVGQKAGIDRELLLDVIAASGMGGPATRNAAEMVSQRDFTPRLSAALMLKDLRLLGELAAATTTPVPLAAAAQQLFAATVASGWGELDRAAVLLLLERLAGLEENRAEPGR